MVLFVKVSLLVCEENTPLKNTAINRIIDTTLNLHKRGCRLRYSSAFVLWHGIIIEIQKNTCLSSENKVLSAAHSKFDFFHYCLNIKPKILTVFKIFWNDWKGMLHRYLMNHFESPVAFYVHILLRSIFLLKEISRF